ncbi:hypothetical protein EIK77_007639 [Talaromyces pinophilus]|nr:hypothetical protein EIK77_007639 [Talaromyces pinophilus]
MSDKSRLYSLNDVIPYPASSIASQRWKNPPSSCGYDTADPSSIAPIVNNHILSDGSIAMKLASIIACDKFRRCKSTITGLIPDRRLNSARYSNAPDRMHAPVDKGESKRAEEERNIRTRGLTRRSISMGVMVCHILVVSCAESNIGAASRSYEPIPSTLEIFLVHTSQCCRELLTIQQEPSTSDSTKTPWLQISFLQQPCATSTHPYPNTNAHNKPTPQLP